jgi:hypothetical protein
MSHCSTEVEECLVSAFREQVRAVMEEGKATSIGAMESAVGEAMRRSMRSASAVSGVNSARQMVFMNEAR